MRPLLLLAALGALVFAPAAAFAQASPSPYTSATRYDAMGRVTGTISADPDTVGSGNPFLAVRNSYDDAGRLFKAETGTLSAWQSEAVAPASWGAAFTVARTLEIQYDTAARKTLESLREGAAGTVVSLTQYSYDSVGRLECTAVRMNPATFASLPASACTLATQGSGGPDRISRNIYDAAGQRLQLRIGVGTADEGATATWAYDLNSQITAMIDGNGNRAEYRYDGYGRQDRWTFPSATRASAYNDATPASALASAGSANAADYEAYGYDPNNNRTSLRKRDGSTLTYTYDALNRMIVKTVPERTTGGQALTTAQTRDVYYGYDLRGLQAFARFDSISGEGVTNTFDGFGRLVATSTSMGGTTRTLSYAWDRDGARTSITHPDGIWFGIWHDGLDRPYYLNANGATGITYANFAAAGPLTAQWRNGTAELYGYDGVQRLSSLYLYTTQALGQATWSYTRNSAGGVATLTRDNDAYAWTGHYAVNRAYTANGLNQYTAAGSASFGYDANGSLTSDGVNSYVYDIENRLVSVTGGHSATLTYDPLGRLWQVATATTTTRFLYDGDSLVAEYDSAGNVLRRYAHWEGADVPMIAYNSATLNDPRNLLSDHQGSIVTLSDPAGNVVALNTYDEYGIPGAANIGRFQYTGQAWLAELGLYYYKARVYSPTLGRFLQTDPIGYDDQYNLYEYVGDDPVNETDPSGQSAAAAAPWAAALPALPWEAAVPALAPAAPFVAAAALVAGAEYIVATTFADPGEQTLAGDTVSPARRNPPVPGTGKAAGRPQHGAVTPGQSGPPRVVRPTHGVKKSDLPQVAGRGGRTGGVIGSEGDRQRMPEQHPGHRGGPPHGHPSAGRGHVWPRPRSNDPF